MQAGTDDDPVRVALVQRVVPGYRVPVFERLAAVDGVELTVFHGTNPDDAARGNTDLSDVDGFDHVALPTTTADPFGLHLVWLSGLLSRRDEYDAFVCSASPSILPIPVLAAVLAVSERAGLVWWGKSLGQKSEPSAVGSAVRRLAEPARATLYRAGDACVCYSTAAAAYFQSYGVDPDRTFVAYNSTDTSTMRALEERHREDPDAVAEFRREYDCADRTVLFFVGTHTAEKHVENLIDAHAGLLDAGHETALVVAGEGPRTEALRRRAEGVPHAHFTGRIPDEELARHFVLADVFAMPGHGGLAVQQAMTFGMPVVSTPLDGTESDLIDDGENGFLVPHDDVDALAAGIERVLDADADRTAAMGARSREIVDDTVNLDRMIAGFVGAIERATGRSVAGSTGETGKSPSTKG